MATPYYRVSGVNLLPYLVDGGLSWEENDVDAPNSGRTLDAVMHRDVVARKDKHTLTFRTLSLEDARTVMGALSYTYVTVQTNIHPKQSGTATFTMYNSSRKAAVYTLDENNTSKWKLDAVSLIER